MKTDTLPRRQVVKAASGLLIATAPSIAKQEENDTGPGVDRNVRNLMGAWTVNVEFPDGTVESSLFVFHAGGTVSQVNSKTRYAGFGVWQQTGRDTFRYTFREQLFDPNSNLLGEVHVHATGKLSENFDRFVAASKGIAFSTTGLDLGSTATISRGTRFTFEEE